jgi:hypothetical protein
LVVALSFRAAYPSKKSVAAQNASNPKQAAVLPRSKRQINRGTAAMRRKLMSEGMATDGFMSSTLGLMDDILNDIKILMQLFKNPACQ